MKQIKISQKVYDELKALMLDKETFNLVIQRILLENKYLKEDKIMLMKIAMQTEDSIAFPTINHSSIFAIHNMLKDTSYSDDDKLGYLKIFLQKDLEKDSNQVLKNIKDFKENYNIGHNILDNLSLWIEETYQE